ncbi:hypothetical protein [Staphylococcus epidermidis]|nr:hypothetical protein [Staphylococcus epidermidis]
MVDFVYVSLQRGGVELVDGDNSVGIDGLIGEDDEFEFVVV